MFTLGNFYAFKENIGSLFLRRRESFSLLRDVSFHFILLHDGLITSSSSSLLSRHHNFVATIIIISNVLHIVMIGLNFNDIIIILIDVQTDVLKIMFPIMATKSLLCVDCLACIS